MPAPSSGRCAISWMTSWKLITHDGVAAKPTTVEARILTCLIRHQDRVVSRTKLSDHRYEAESDRDFKSIEVVIGHLRRKIGNGVIETRRGEGHVLRAVGSDSFGRACCWLKPCLSVALLAAFLLIRHLLQDFVTSWSDEETLAIVDSLIGQLQVDAMYGWNG